MEFLEQFSQVQGKLRPRLSNLGKLRPRLSNLEKVITGLLSMSSIETIFINEFIYMEKVQEHREDRSKKKALLSLVSTLF